MKDVGSNVTPSSTKSNKETSVFLLPLSNAHMMQINLSSSLIEGVVRSSIDSQQRSLQSM